MSRATVIVTTWFPTPEAPGRSPFVADWARVLRNFGPVQVVHGDRSATSSQRWCLEEDISVLRAPLRGGGTGNPVAKAADTIELARIVRQVVQASDAALINAHAYPAAASAGLASIAGRTRVWTIEHFTRLVRPDIGWPQRAEARLAYRLSDEVSVVGAVLAPAVHELGARRVQVVGNPLRRDAEYVPRRTPTDDHVRLLSVGRLEQAKNFDALIDAVAALPERFLLDLIGDGSLAETLQRQVVRLGVSDRVDFRGALPPDEVQDAMGHADIVVVPSHVETFSMVAAEALAAGRPVVTTPNGGPDTWMDSGWGTVARDTSAHALADALRTQATKLTEFDGEETSRAVRARYSIAAVAERVEPIVRSLTRPRGRAGGHAR